MIKADKSLVVRKILMALIFLIAMTFIMVKYGSYIMSLLTSGEEFRNVIITYGNWGVFVLIGFQILQIVIPIIPGEVVQIAGGYVYGMPLGITYLLTGTLIGGIISFYLARFIGYPLVKIFIDEGKLDKFSFLIKSKKAEVVLFILFLIPGIPKDTLIYIAGLTPIRPLRFFTILTIARIPGILGTTFIGSNLLEKNYRDICIAGAVIILLITSGIAFRKKILKRFTGQESLD